MCYDNRIKVGEAVFAVGECGGTVSIKQVSPTQGDRVSGTWNRNQKRLDAKVPPEVKAAVEADLVAAHR